MRTITRTALALVGTAALVGSMAMPAAAAPDDTTTTTVQVDGGTLDITAPTNAASGSIAVGQSAAINLPGISVTDNRAVIGTWSASVHMTALEGQIEGNVLAPTSADYVPAVAATTGDPVMAAVSSVSLINAVDDGSKVAAQTATSVAGNNTATWDAVLTVVTPAQVLADTYTATMTHSVL